jgi:signal transduction histidine kinase
MKSGMLGGGSQGRGQRRMVAPTRVAPSRVAPTWVAHTWRHDVLDAMLRVAALVGPILVVLAMVFRRGPRLDVVSALMVGSVALLVSLRFLHALPFRLRAALAIAVLYTAGLPALVRSGFAMGSAAAMAAAIVLAVVLLGRGPAFLLLVVTAVVMGALGAAVGAGHFVPRAIDSNPDIPANWFRMGITFDLVAAMLMVAVEFAVLHIEKNYLEAAAALERLTEEQRRRAVLESERRNAELGWQRCAQELIALGKHPAVEAGELATAFGAITEAGARGLDVERCSVWLLDDARGEIGCQDLYERAPGRHSSGQRLASVQAPAYFGALEAERAIAAHDARTDRRTRELAVGYLEPLGITSMLDAPIRFQDHVVGVVCHEHTGAALVWSEAQQSFAGSLADFAARVLAGADRQAKERALRTVNTELGQLNRRLESAKEDERRFIARELHDELGQTLTALKLRLKMGARAADPERAERESAATFAIIDSLIDRVRKLSLDLRPALLDEVGLIPALRAYLDAQAAISEVRIELDASAFEGRASPEAEIACFRIVQEAVTNVLRHAEARRVSVRLEQRTDRLQIVVEDDGHGIAPGQIPDAAAQGHMGIVGMRERARALGGEFAIDSEPGAGTAVRVTLPVGRGGGLPAADRPEESARR